MGDIRLVSDRNFVLMCEALVRKISASVERDT